MITLQPSGGLCDRLVTIEYFMYIQKLLNLGKIRVIWSLDKDCKCSYKVLFKPIEGLQIVDNNRLQLLNGGVMS